MQFVVSKQNLQKELGFVQGVVEKKNTIPVLSNILIESVGESTIRITGTDLDVTIRCDMDAEEITTPGSMCVQARKLFEIARLLPDAPVSFKKEDNEWVTVKCDRARFKMVGVARDAFPEVPSFKSAPTKLPATVIKTFIDRTIFAITQEPFIVHRVRMFPQAFRQHLCSNTFVFDDQNPHASGTAPAHATR